MNSYAAAVTPLGVVGPLTPPDFVTPPPQYAAAAQMCAPLPRHG